MTGSEQLDAVYTEKFTNTLAQFLSEYNMSERVQKALFNRITRELKRMDEK